MYVKSFRRWIVDGDNNSKPMKGAGLSNLPMDEGWVNPTTTTELWWPRDLTKLQARPMLNVLFRNGMISYVSAGLDVRVPHSKNDDDGVTSWRNYGMNSQPIARQWTGFDVAMDPLFHVEAFVLHNDEEQKPTTLFQSCAAQDVMQNVAMFIAELDSLSPIAEGFHIVSFPMIEHWTDLPSPDMSEREEEKGGDSTRVIYKIVCLGTSEPFAINVLDMDEDSVKSTSVLEVTVSRTARGGDSPYLPEIYKGLYVNA